MLHRPVESAATNGSSHMSGSQICCYWFSNSTGAKKNLDANGAIAESVAAFGVLITLIYFAGQARQNTVQMLDSVRDAKLLSQYCTLDRITDQIRRIIPTVRSEPTPPFVNTTTPSTEMFGVCLVRVAN